jgi:hypothetical protein
MLLSEEGYRYIECEWTQNIENWNIENRNIEIDLPGGG